MSSAGNSGSLAHGTSGCWEGDFNPAGGTWVSQWITQSAASPGYAAELTANAADGGNYTAQTAGDHFVITHVVGGYGTVGAPAAVAAAFALP